jgi:hypothetical protein
MELDVEKTFFFDEAFIGMCGGNKVVQFYAANEYLVAGLASSSVFLQFMGNLLSGLASSGDRPTRRVAVFDGQSSHTIRE